jgi:hypothetical protein
MSKTTENTDKLLKFIADKFEAGELDNNSYNGAKNFRQVITILNQKLIIDNK